MLRTGISHSSLTLSSRSEKEEQAALAKTEALSHKTEKPKDSKESVSVECERKGTKRKSITLVMLFLFVESEGFEPSSKR